MNTAHVDADVPIAKQSSRKFCEIIESKALSRSWRENSFSTFRGVRCGGKLPTMEYMDDAKLLQRKYFLYHSNVRRRVCMCAAENCVFGRKCTRRHVQIEQWHRIESDIAGEKMDKSKKEATTTYGSVAKLCVHCACEWLVAILVCL